MAGDSIGVVRLPLEGRVRGRWLRTIGVVGVTVLAAAPILMAVARQNRADQVASAAYWRLDGPPCAPLDPAAFRNRAEQLAQATPYDETLYRRRGGAMTCTHRTEEIDGAPVRHPVCKFTSPDQLVVSIGGQDHFYDLTMGRSAAVEVVKGRVRCVVTRPFDM